MSTTSPPPGGPTGPEYLEQGGGEPVPPSSSGGGGRRTALIAGGAVVLLAAAGAGTWAAMSFLGSGTQAAEALPSDTLAYASVDLDPSGSQKIEAVRMLNKFPAIKKELGLDAEDDIRRKIFEAAECDGLSYDDDVAPWIGATFALAAVDAGEEKPSPVGLMEVTDASGAEDGLTKLADCEGEGNGGGFVVEGDWAYYAETEEIARSAADAAADSTLADSADHQRWMDEVGDPGVMNMYAAPGAGQVISELMSSDLAQDPAMGELPPGAADEMTKMFEDFGGAAATVRFADGALEVEYAADLPEQNAMILPIDEDTTLELVDSLPDDTAVAYGAALPEGWADSLVDALGTYGIPPEQIEQGLAQAEAQTGLTLPEDLETLLGEQFVVAFGGGVDMEALMNSGDPTGIPLGVKVRGDAAGVEDVMGKLGQSSGMPEMFETETSGDDVVWSLGPDYRSTLAEGGSLGDTDTFQAAVPEADRANSVLFVNFDAGNWLDEVAAMDPAVGDNLEPLTALGISGWLEDGTSHGQVRLATD
ncbi:DUF3352 domain-containing protein [Nocardioides sp. GXQ0305]|uniref:DUF3352 domain-containing protein n=1 Tax=Nocardioides sp. GXQ0305 TaxID=3423912 RepID=UPI003D7D5CE2